MAENVFYDANHWDFDLPNTEELQDFDVPNTEEFQAANALKGAKDQEIKAWLAFSRERGFESSSNHTLAQKHVDAYRILQGKNDLVVLHWIHGAQSIGRSCVP